MDEAARARSGVDRQVWLAGGGSGGHVFPAVAVGEELARRGWRVSFAGRAGGMEQRLVEARELEFVALAARPVIGRGPLARAAALWTLARSARAARRLIVERGVAAVVGTGGYASAPAALGAAWARRPLLLVEPNARPGAANRWLSRVASALACPSFVAGVPVRAEFFAVPALGAAAPPRLLVLGGSQGSRRLNQLVPAAVGAIAAGFGTGSAGSGPAVVHQCGERWVEETTAAWRAAADAGGLDPARVAVRPFVADVAGALAAASLVVSRAGAITLAELCAAGRGAVLVPLALAGGHQRDNAEHLAAAGAAQVTMESETTPESLARMLAELLGDPARLAAMGARARALARPGAAAAIADRLERLTAGDGA